MDAGRATLRVRVVPSRAAGVCARHQRGRRPSVPPPAGLPAVRPSGSFPAGVTRPGGSEARGWSVGVQVALGSSWGSPAGKADLEDIEHGGACATRSCSTERGAGALVAVRLHTMASKHRTDGFAEAGLSGSLLTAIAALGYEEPTPVQREAIPHLLAGSDVLAHAATGTGKTAAFALPLLSRLASTPAKGRATRGLVLVPTRELAMQVSEAIHKYARGSGL